MNKSLEEYKAAAMLLGMDYSELVHCFVKDNYPASDDWYNPDTMELIPVSEKLNRIVKFSREHPPPYNPDTEVLMWEGKQI